MTAAVLIAALACAPARASSIFPTSPFSDKAAGTTGAAFLKLPNGARYEALGGSAAAGVEGADSLFWNPAGLGRFEAESPSDLTLSYAALLDGMYAGAVGYARPHVGPGTLGFGLVYYAQPAQTAYSNVGDPTGNFAPNDLAFSSAYGMTFGGMRAGAALKLIRSSIADVTGTTMALDLGVQADRIADVGDGPFDVGMALTNLGPPLKLGSVASPLPFSIRGGTMWHASPWFNALLDVVVPVDQDIFVTMGGEALLKQPSFTAALRLGFNQARTRGLDGFAGITGGVGIDFKRFRLDYAWVPYGDLGTTNKVTLAFRF